MGLLGGFPFVAYCDGVFPEDGYEGWGFGLGLFGVDSVFLGLFVACVVSDDLVGFDWLGCVVFWGAVGSCCHGLSPFMVCVMPV